MRPAEAGFRRPSGSLAALALLAFAVLCALGVWQLARRAEKAALLETLAVRSGAPPIDAPPTEALAAGGDPAALDYRAATVAGRFDHAHEMRVYGRSYRGAAGVHIVTPLFRSDGRGVVLVDRGFVPMDRVDPATRARGQVAGEVTVTGVLRLPARPGWLTPANEPARNIWFRIDPTEMGGAAALAPAALVPYVLAAADTLPGGPVGRPVAVDLANDHLQYALTWFALALALAVMFALYHRRPPPRAGEGP